MFNQSKFIGAQNTTYSRELLVTKSHFGENILLKINLLDKLDGFSQDIRYVSTAMILNRNQAVPAVQKCAQYNRV